MIVETMMRETILNWAGIEEEELKEEEKQILREDIRKIWEMAQEEQITACGWCKLQTRRSKLRAMGQWIVGKGKKRLEALQRQILELLTEEPLTTVSICRKVQQYYQKERQEKTTWCDCRGVRNKRQRKKREPPDETCQVKYHQVTSALTKLMIAGEVIGVRCRVRDRGQARKWDLMTTYYLWEGQILENLGQRKIIKPYQTKITAYTKGERRAMNKGKIE